MKREKEREQKDEMRDKRFLLHLHTTFVIATVGVLEAHQEYWSID